MDNAYTLLRPHLISCALFLNLGMGCSDDSSSTSDANEREVSAGESVAGAGEESNAGERAGDVAGMESAGEMSAGDHMIDGGSNLTDPCEMPIERCDGDFEPPPPLNEHTGTYVEDERTLVIFGGNTSVPENCGFPAYTGESTTWLYYDAPLTEGCGPWVRVEGGPPGRARHSATYAEGAVWVFGGRVRSGTSGPYRVFNDLWRFDVAQRTWSEVSPSNSPPAGRYNTSLTYDIMRRSLWVFGGNIAGNALSPDAARDLWRFDLETSTWHQVETPDYLGDRMWHNVVYDASRDRLVIFGGADESAFANDASYFNDLIFFNLSDETWGRAELESAPDPRFWSQMVYRSTTGEYLIFGGHDDQLLGNRNDTWVFNPLEGLWASIGGEDTYNRPANGFCDFPPDFTIVDRALPERRNAHSFSWSQTCDHGLLFGGKTDCGAINDVWRYLPERGWENRELATEGELCHRWRSNPDNCSNMCF